MTNMALNAYDHYFLKIIEYFFLFDDICGRFDLSDNVYNKYNVQSIKVNLEMLSEQMLYSFKGVSLINTQSLIFYLCSCLQPYVFLNEGLYVYIKRNNR